MYYRVGREGEKHMFRLTSTFVTFVEKTKPEFSAGATGDTVVALDQHSLFAFHATNDWHVEFASNGSSEEMKRACQAVKNLNDSLIKATLRSVDSVQKTRF